MTSSGGQQAGVSNKIWPSEDIFYGRIKNMAERLFGKLDKRLAPRVFVLCVPAEDGGVTGIVLKQDDQWEYDPGLFSEVLARTDERYQENERQHLGGRFPAVEVGRRRLEAFQDAVQQILSPSDADRGLVSYSSQPVEINGYKVSCVLQLNAEAYNSHYSLPEVKWRGSVRLPKSLVDAAAVEYLKACAKTLKERAPGHDLNPRLKVDEILYLAGQTLTSRAAAEGCNAPLDYAFDALNAVSLATHEGGNAMGKVRIVTHDHPDLTKEVEFLNPVEMDGSRAARKMIEMASRDVDLLCNGYQIYGLGRLREHYDEHYGEVYTVEYPGNHGWLLKHGGDTLMKVQYGKPSLPGELLDEEVFRDHVDRIFKDGTQVDRETLRRITKWAEKQKHGTMIVISSGAEAEAARLSKQSQLIKPVFLTEDNLLAVTAIDGSVLVDPTGKCYAVGVIIDGVASEEGTSARGSRFNSAIRYVTTNTGGHQCLILVVSEDGTIDLVPELKPRIRRSELDGYVERLRAVGESERVDTREYFRVMQWINTHHFYLSAQDCDVVNGLKNDISSRPGVGTSWPDFEPNEKMNGSYFTD